MNIFITIFLSTLVSQPVAAPHGGATGVGNGGGGDKVQVEALRPLSSVGEFLMKRKASLQPGYETFSKKYSIDLQSCRHFPDLKFPPMPKDLDARFVFEGRAYVENGEALIPLSLEKICESRKLIEAYQGFMFALYDAKDDKIFQYLAHKIMLFDRSPVVIELHKAEKSFPARGGKINEFAWFDSNTGHIGWSPRSQDKTVIEVMLSRCDSSFLIHELAHVFSYRLYKGYDPVPYWHDVRFEKAITELDGGIQIVTGTHLYDFETSVYASFIEGVSNLAELVSAGGSHPMIDVDLAYFISDSKQPDQYYTWAVPRFYQSQERVLSNPYFVTSFLAKFVREDFYTDKGMPVYKFSEERILKLLNVIEVLKTPQGIIDVMKRYDEIYQTDEGWRFVREFLLYDYRENRDIRKDFTVKLEDSIFRGRIEYFYTNEKVPPSTLYSPAIDATKKQAYKDWRKSYAATISREQLMEDFTKFVKEDEKWILYTSIDMPTLEKNMNEVSSYFGKRLDFNLPLSVQIRDELRKFNIDASAISIDRAEKLIQNPNEAFSFQMEVLKKISDHDREILQAIKDKPEVSLDSDTHIQQVFEWRDAEIRYKNPDAFDALLIPHVVDALMQIKTKEVKK
jgi:hypothetical protein